MSDATDFPAWVEVPLEVHVAFVACATAVDPPVADMTIIEDWVGSDPHRRAIARLIDWYQRTTVLEYVGDESDEPIRLLAWYLVDDTTVELALTWPEGEPDVVVQARAWPLVRAVLVPARVVSNVLGWAPEERYGDDAAYWYTIAVDAPDATGTVARVLDLVARRSLEHDWELELRDGDSFEPGLSAELWRRLIASGLDGGVDDGADGDDQFDAEGFLQLIENLARTIDPLHVTPAD
jgi:hypothetical protein